MLGVLFIKVLLHVTLTESHEWSMKKQWKKNNTIGYYLRLKLHISMCHPQKYFLSASGASAVQCSELMLLVIVIRVDSLRD